MVYISHEVNTSFYKKTSEYISQQNHVHPNLALSKIKACMSPTPCFPNNSSLKESFVLNILPSSELSLMVSFLWLFKSDLLFDPYMFLFSAFLLSVYFLSHSFVQDVCISHLRQLPGAQLWVSPAPDPTLPPCCLPEAVKTVGHLVRLFGLDLGSSACKLYALT